MYPLLALWWETSLRLLGGGYQHFPTHTPQNSKLVGGMGQTCLGKGLPEVRASVYSSYPLEYGLGDPPPPPGLLQPPTLAPWQHSRGDGPPAAPPQPR